MKKIISIILVVALLLGFIAMTVSVASADAPQPEINAVAITGVTEPVVGQTPTLDGITLGGADGVNYLAQWYEVTDTGLVLTYAFENNKTYVLYFELSTEPGNSMSQSIAVTVNGQPADEQVWYGENDVRVEMVYHLGQIQVLDQLSITQIPEITLGKSFEATDLFGSVAVNAGVQADPQNSALYKDVYNNTQSVDSGVFEKTAYFMDIRFTSQSGYYISPSSSVALPAGVDYEIVVRNAGYLVVRIYMDLRDKVDTVEVTGVPQLEVGGSFTVEGITATAGANVMSAFWTDNMFQTLDSNATVQEDVYYQLHITLEPADGCAFADDVLVTLEGMPQGTNWSGSRDGNYYHISKSYRFSQPTVGTIRVAGLPESIAVGPVPTVSMVTDNRRVTLGSTRWTDLHGNPVTAFEAGKGYYLECTATAKEGYTFSPWEGMICEETMNGPRERYVEEGVLHNLFYYHTYEEINALDMTLTGVAIGDKAEDVKLTLAQENVLVDELTVMEKTEDGEQEASGTFVKEKTYIVQAIILAKEGYSFGNLVGTLNGAEHGFVHFDDQMAVMLYTITANKSISNVQISVKEPVAGEKMTAPTVSTPNVKLGQWDWYDQTAQEGGLTDEVFQDGHRYQLNVELVADEGYAFDQNARVENTTGTMEGWYTGGMANELLHSNWGYSLCKTIEKVELPAMPEKLEIGDQLTSGSLQVPAGANYIASGVWYEVGTEVSGEAEGGVIYEYRYTIYPKSGWQVTEDTQILVGGEAWSGNDPVDFGSYAGISRYYPVDMKTIEKVELTVPVPAAGKPIEKATASKDAGYQVSWTKWYTGDQYASNTDKTFVAGKHYTVEMDVRAGLNSAFAENVQVYVNGKLTQCEWVENSGMWLYLELDMGQVSAEPGKVEDTTNAAENDHAAKLEVPEAELADKLLTQEEKKLVEAGASVTVDLVVEDISKKVPKEDKALVEKALGKNTVGLYLDISLIKQVGDSQPVKITETNGAVTVTITVPQALRNTDTKVARTYKVIRVHEGKTDVLDATYDAATGKLSFATDAFSTYALVYTDAPVTGTNAATGDDMPVVALIALTVLAAAGMAIVMVNKKKFV